MKRKAQTELQPPADVDSDSSSDSSVVGDDDAPAIDAASLPAPASARKVGVGKGKATAKPGVVYLGRIPRGFYEDQMRAYFSQFGDVTRLRLSRNHKTGASRHYAFLEFASAEVAQIVAETMHNYLLLGHMLQCRVLPEDQIHPRMWVGANKRFRPKPLARIARDKVNSDKTPAAKRAIKRRLQRGDEAKRKRIAAAGIDYDFAGHKARAVAAADAPTQ